MKNKRVRILLVLIILLIFEMMALSYNYFFVYQFEMIGDDPYVTNYGEKYKDPGVIVKIRGKRIKDYKIESNLNTSKLGKYIVKYIIGNKVRQRVVEVKDIKGPDIQFDDDSITINYKSEYKEPGFKAIDNYDGDVTDNVKTSNNIDSSKLGEYKVIYEVKDSSNNETKKERKVIVSDIEKPVIKFKNNYGFAILGNKIDINDYEAIDNYDGNITSKVSVDGTINNKKEGTYTIKYKVSDSSNNEQIVTRTINVQSKNTAGIPVLMYHWFYDDTKGEKPGNVNAHNYISKTELEKQLKYIKSNNYYYPTWNELVSYIDGKTDLPKKSIIFTDDDCKTSFFDVALPLFQKYEIPVTSFCISKKDIYKKYINAEYLDLESHTNDMHKVKCNTAWFGALMCSSYQEIYDDIKLSVSKLGNNNAFAYPYGHYCDTAIKALKDNGIKVAFTINEGRVKKGMDKYKLPRVRISSWTDIDTYKNLVK